MVTLMSNPVPIALQKSNETTLKISWSDATFNEYDVRKLRFNCSCAKCVNEWNGERIIKFEDVPKNMKPSKIDSVGNYAIKITWADGHDSGIYTYQALKNTLPSLTEPIVCSHEHEEETNEKHTHDHNHKGCNHHH